MVCFVNDCVIGVHRLFPQTSMASRGLYRIFVGNLPWTVGKHELHEYFSQFGQIANATVIFNKETGLNRGYGFVKFANESAFKSATKKATHFLDGSAIIVQDQAKNNHSVDSNYLQ